jgi:hypothetical protein
MKIDDSSPRVLTSLLTETEAQVIVNHLESVGIKARLCAGPRPEMPCEAQVVVRLADLDRAKQALADIQKK